MVTGGAHKWLCGGPGTAFLWVRPGLEQQLRDRPQGNSGGPGSTLPSVRGQSRVADPLAPNQVNGAVQERTGASGAGDGVRPVGPRGKPKPKRP